MPLTSQTLKGSSLKTANCPQTVTIHVLQSTFSAAMFSAVSNATILKVNLNPALISFSSNPQKVYRSVLLRGRRRAPLGSSGSDGVAKG